MFRLGKLVFWFGSLIMFYPFAAAFRAWFRLHSALEKLNQQQDTGSAFFFYITDVAPSFSLTFAVGLICFIAGRLILKHRKAGWWAWAILCVIQVFSWIAEVLLQDASMVLFLRGILWLSLALITLQAFRSPNFKSWWSVEHAL